MTNIQNGITYLKDYQVPAFLIETINLDIDLYDEQTIVIATMTVKKNPHSLRSCKHLILHGCKLSLEKLKLNDTTLLPTAYEVAETELIIHNVPAEFNLEITTKIEPHQNTALVGLYKSKTMYCTQCEAEGFRRIIYYLDRPDVMAKFTTTIKADKKRYPVLLANGNLIATADVPNGRHLATWEDPFKKPSYLFAMVAGNLVAAQDHFVTQSGRLVTLQIYVELDDLSKTTHALKALKKAMLWDEENYGREYDLDIYMIVAVGDFNMGAMENKGLNIFNTKYVLASPQTATDYDFDSIDTVIAHEYFHNWSGNRVTCRDWFQLSLKEGFTVFRDQQFTRDVTESPISRIEQFKVLLTKQFVEDAGPLAHPVRPSSYKEINNFYTMTVYEKGAEIIRMLQVILGKDKFREATDLYFARHDGMAATIEDFIAAMQDVSGANLEQFKLWYTQVGTPEVTVKTRYNEQQAQYTIILQQNCLLPMQIPIAVGLLDPITGENMPLQLITDDIVENNTKVLAFTKAQQEFIFVNITQNPVLSILRDFSAPIKLETSLTNDELAFLAKHDSDDFNRWDAVRRLKKNIILEMIKQVQTNTKLVVDPLLMETYKNILLDKAVNLALKAEMLILPSSAEILKYTTVADPETVYQVKSFLKSELVCSLQAEFLLVYQACLPNNSYVHAAQASAKRHLKNTCLAYVMWLNTKATIEVGVKQFYAADNMTDMMGVLQAITQIDCAARLALLADFYVKWRHDPLIMDKWLSLQATSELPHTIEHIQALLQHEIFDLNNPNKVYALIGGFAGNNPIRFHDNSGIGYKILADLVIKLDKLNPQVAARIVSPLADEYCYDQHRQKLINQQLMRIMAESVVSRNLAEIVNKCLKQ